MSTTLTVNGVGYPFPSVGERPWAQKIINWATAVTGGMLQKSGGTFTLTSEVDFGATYGLKSAYVKTRSSNPSSTGIVRLSNNEGLAWRNAGNSADLTLKANASNLLEFNSSEIATFATVNKTEFGYLSGVTSGLQAQISGKVGNPMSADGDMIYRSGGVPVALPRGTDGQVLSLAGGVPSWTTLSSSGRTINTSGASGVWSTSTGSYVAVTNFSVNITTLGGPVFVMLIPNAAPTTASIAIRKNGSNSVSQIKGYLKLLRDASDIGIHYFTGLFPADTSTSHFFPIGTVYWIDAPAAGTYTYSIEGSSGDTDSKLVVSGLNMVVFEL